MNDVELCQSLMNAIAGTPCPLTCATAAIHASGLVLLWDDRPHASWPLVEAVASEVGEVLTTASIERGPHGRLMTGAIVRPHAGDLDAAAMALRARYLSATAPAELPPDHASSATQIRRLSGRIAMGHAPAERSKKPASRAPHQRSAGP